MTLILKSSVATGNTALPILRRDPILDGDGGGVSFMFDTAFSWCVPATAPLNGTVIRDISETGDGEFNLTAGQTMAYAGGGFDFSSLTNDPAEVVGGVGSLAGIYSGNQYFMVVGWFKLPISSDWKPDIGLTTMFETTANGAGYTVASDMVTIGQINSPSLNFRRQTNGSTHDVMSISPALHYDRVAQIAFWRNAAGQGARLRSAGGTTSAAAAVGSVNSGNFSTRRPRWGVPTAFNNLNDGNPTVAAVHRAATNMRLYRGWVENLEVSERDPVTVLDADYAFVTGLARYS